jgi:hypothetical protein
MPEPPPVMRMVLPVMFMMMIPLVTAYCETVVHRDKQAW